MGIADLWVSVYVKEEKNFPNIPTNCFHYSFIRFECHTVCFFFKFDILFYYLFSMNFSLWWRHHWTGNTVDWTGQNIMDSNVSYKIDSNYHFSLSKSIKGQMQLGVFHEIISLCHKVSYSFIYLEEYASHVTNRICPKLELWIYFLKNFLKG